MRESLRWTHKVQLQGVENSWASHLVRFGEGEFGAQRRLGADADVETFHRAEIWRYCLASSPSTALNSRRLFYRRRIAVFALARLSMRALQDNSAPLREYEADGDDRRWLAQMHCADGCLLRGVFLAMLSKGILSQSLLAWRHGAIVVQPRRWFTLYIFSWKDQV